MKERPILFSGAMVRALLAGTKTQTRRVVKPWTSKAPSNKPAPADLTYLPDFTCYRSTCPYGQPGDRLWVREAFRPIYPQQESYNGGNAIGYDYREGYQLGYRMGDSISPPKWKPGIHMPRGACRIVLEIVSVRIERLNDICGNDCIAEGAWREEDKALGRSKEAIEAYSSLWQSINGQGSWDANPWVWVIEFKRVEGGAV